MTLEELEGVVALVCNKRVKFTIESRGWKGKDKWAVSMYLVKPYQGSDETYWKLNTGWRAFGPTYAKAMEHAQEVALSWADNRNEFNDRKKGWHT